MKIETKEIYKCEYCNKLYQIKRFAERHEIDCKRNPDNYRKCLDWCSHLKKKSTMDYYDQYDGEHEQSISLLYCKKKNIFLYPPKVEHAKKWFELGDELNEPMPTECNDYDSNVDYIEIFD